MSYQKYVLPNVLTFITLNTNDKKRCIAKFVAQSITNNNMYKLI